jgi:flagellar biosynthesis protein FlhB
MSVATDDPATEPGPTASLPGRVAGAIQQTASDAYRYGAAARGRDATADVRTLRSGQMTNQFTMMIQVAVTLAVGVLIVGQIFDALPATSGPLSNASDQVESLTATAFELAPVVLIVVVAALVIGVVRRI